MELLPIYDRAYNGNLAAVIESVAVAKGEFFQSFKVRGETSLKRDDLRPLVLEYLAALEGFERFDEQCTGFDNYWYLVGHLEGAIFMFTFYGRDYYCTVSSNDLDYSERVAQSFKDLIPKPDPPKIDHVIFDFYMLGPDGTTKIPRSLIAPSWDQIAHNYQAETRRQIQNLVDLNPETIGEGGKLILLHGEPGLGKSYAIRALMKSMQNWARPSYLMDPEKFFSVPSYMFDIILSNRDDENEKWRLIIAEDSDEFIRADAKERTGQGLSRLLNLADGILGQGLKVIFLLTTNEPLKNLHQAVIRPGRCIANIEFRAFDLADARQWFDEEGGWPERLETKNKYSLAELFDAQRTHQQIKEENKTAVATGQYL
jgi:hypothetical protein